MPPPPEEKKKNLTDTFRPGMVDVLRVFRVPECGCKFGYFSESLPPLPPGAPSCNTPVHVPKLVQKTREGCGCFWGLFGGSPGKLRESPGKIAGKFFLNREMLQILGFGAPGKANLPRTLGAHRPEPCPDLPHGEFFEIDSSSLLEFFWPIDGGLGRWW